MAKSPKQIVNEVEEALKNSTACPYCGLYDGTHQVTCEYLKHKGNVDAEREEKPTKAEKKEVEETRETEEKDSDEKQKLLDSMKKK